MNLSLPPKTKAKNDVSISVLSFFTGAGFLDMGLIQAGFDVVWHNENSIPFIRGFEYGMRRLYGDNYHSKIQNTKSIMDICSEQIIEEAFSNQVLPDVFGIVGGPPCPDFSVAGNNMGKDGEHGQLSKVYVDKILEIKPSFFIFENVPGLLRTTQHRAFLSELLDSLSKIYQIDIETLNALDYGVPQDRERVFIIGVKHEWLSSYDYPLNTQIEINWKKVLDFRSKTTFSKLEADEQLRTSINPLFKSWFPWPKPLFPNSKTGFAWPDIVETSNTPLKPVEIPEQLMVNGYICDRELSNLPNQKDYFLPHSPKFSWIKEGDVHRKSFKRLHRYRYSPSVAYGNNEVHLHPIERRRLSVREALRLQTVPDTYALPDYMTLSSKFKTIGNGVPVKLAYEISNALMNFLEGVINEKF